MTATAGNGQNVINWATVTGATSYNVYWSTTSGVTKATGTKVAGVTSPYTHAGLTGGTTYYYVVTAVNATGESVESSQVSATPSASVLILSENFEDNILDPRISVETVGSFSSNPGIKDISNFGSTKAFGYGSSTCGASCFDSYVTNLKITFPSPTYVSTISFKEMELYGNWGSCGEIYIDGNGLFPDAGSCGTNTFGKIPHNDWQADTTFRTQSFSINNSVSSIVLKIRDITNSSEIFIDDIEVKGLSNVVSSSVTSCSFSGSNVTAKDSTGKELWNYTVGSTVTKCTVGDINNDGTNEVVAGTDRDGTDKGVVYALSREGVKLWSYKTGATGIFWPDDQMPVIAIRIADVDNDGNPEVVTLSYHYYWYPERLCVFNGKTGELKGDYWNPGRATSDDSVVVADLDGDGINEIIVGSGNNDSGNVAAVYVLKGNNVSGQAPPYYGSSSQGTQIWYSNLGKPVNESYPYVTWVEVLNDINSDSVKDLKCGGGTKDSPTYIRYLDGKFGGLICNPACPGGTSCANGQCQEDTSCTKTCSDINGNGIFDFDECECLLW